MLKEVFEHKENFGWMESRRTNKEVSVSLSTVLLKHYLQIEWILLIKKKKKITNKKKPHPTLVSQKDHNSNPLYVVYLGFQSNFWRIHSTKAVN